MSTKKNYKKLTFNTKEQWLFCKQKTIGSSEASAILNQSKWLTPNDIYNKFHGKQKNISTNERMKEGVRAEEHIRQLFALDYKNKFIVKTPPKNKHWTFRRLDKPYLSCSPDSLLINKETSKLWGHEIKDVELIKSTDREIWETNTLPLQYFYQIIHYLVVMNDMEGVVLTAHLKYFKRNDATNQFEFDYALDKSFFLYRSDALKHIEHLEKKETEFYEKNIKGHVRPPLSIKF